MAVINGSSDNDVRFGSERDDRISGFGGNDLLLGNAGRDLVFGGDGNDTIEGGADPDTLYGEAGRDVLVGGAARDYLDGGAGVDIARYSGKSTDYRISKITADSYFVADLRRVGDGTDELKSVERLFFAGDNKTTYLNANKAPVAGNDFGSSSENSGTPATGNVLVNDSDADLDALTVSALRTGAEFGFGAPGTIGSALGGQYGSLTLYANGSYSYTVSNSNATVNALNVGQSVVDNFTYTVSDGNGGTDQATLAITINGANDAPVAFDDSNTAMAAMEPDPDATGNVLTNDTDVDGPAKSVSDVRTGAEFGSGTTGTVGAPLAGQYGSLTLAANGAYSYVVNDANPAVIALGAGGNVVDSFTYTVADGNGGTDQATLAITINGANDGPVAVNDLGAGTEDTATPITGNVLTNDTDADLDPLSVTAVRTGPEADAGTSGTPGSALVGTYGSLTLNADGSYSYVVDNANESVDALNDGDTLTDNFTYTVSDGQGGTDTATLAITINGATDAIAGGNALLVGNEIGADDEALIEARGYTADRISFAEFETADLSGYSDIWIAWYGLIGNPDEMLDDRLTEFFAQGGNLFMEVYQHSLDFLPITGVSKVDDVHGDAVTVTDPSSLVVAGLSSAQLSNWSDSYHSYFSSVGTFDVIATGDSGPVLIGESIGNGNLVLTAMDPSFHATGGTGETVDKIDLIINTFELPPGYWADGFFGKDLTYDYLFPNSSTSEGTAFPFTTSASVEIPANSPANNSQFFQVDVSDKKIVITFVSDVSFTSATFNGFKLTDVANNVPDITGVSDDSASVATSFDANNVYVNWQSLSFVAGEVISIDVTFPFL